jgi:DNA-binding response OmpR family regulator
MSRRILLLEDDPNLGLILQEHLQLNGFEIVLCLNGEEGLDHFCRGGYDLCLVDVMMPRMDGFAFAREVRRRDSHTPLIFLTAKSLKEDKIEGFKIGCDDYITKPFSVEELLLRVQAVLRRSGGDKDEPVEQFSIGNYAFDSLTRVLKIGKSERKLTGRESDLLCLLCQRVNHTLERSVALRELWGDESYFNARSMDVFISKLRKYLADDDRIEIANVHGIGFKLTIRQ